MARKTGEACKKGASSIIAGIRLLPRAVSPGDITVLILPGLSLLNFPCHIVPVAINVGHSVTSIADRSQDNVADIWPYGDGLGFIRALTQALPRHFAEDVV